MPDFGVWPKLGLRETSMQSMTTALSLPTVIWSGILAAIISLAGIIISNRSSLERLRTQLRHDGGEKHKDRLTAMRKEVYLQLFTDITLARRHLFALASKTPTIDDLSTPLETVDTQLSKIQLIGSTESMNLARELSFAYAKSFSILLIAAKPFHSLKTEIRLNKQTSDQYWNDCQRIISEINMLNESGEQDDARMDSLKQSLENFRGHYNHFNAQWSEASDRYFNSRDIYMAAAQEQISEIDPIEAKLTAALRDEIGLGTILDG